MDSKTLKALQFFYDRGPTPFLKLNSYLGEFSAEYRYLLTTGRLNVLTVDRWLKSQSPEGMLMNGTNLPVK